MKPKALEKLAWVLIYSGLLLAALGLFLRDASPTAGLALIVVGVLDVASGVVAIVVRSRMPDVPPSKEP